MARKSKFSPEVRERSVRPVFEHKSDYGSEWEAIGSIAATLGCTAETLRGWVRQAERDQGRRTGLTSNERERLKELETEGKLLEAQRLEQRTNFDLEMIAATGSCAGIENPSRSCSLEETRA